MDQRHVWSGGRNGIMRLWAYKILGSNKDQVQAYKSKKATQVRNNQRMVIRKYNVSQVFWADIKLWLAKNSG